MTLFLCSSVFFLERLRTDLYGATLPKTVTCNFLTLSARIIEKNRKQLTSVIMASGYDCHRIHKYVSKSCDIFFVVINKREQVVALIYTKQLVL